MSGHGAPRRAGRRSGGSLARGLAALAALVLLVAGVPAALWLAVGWPLPHAVPSVEELREAISGSTIPDEFFPRALAVLAWLVWAQLMVSVVLELVATLRGGLAARLPGAGWSQAIASHLVGTVMLLVSTVGVARPAIAAEVSPPRAAAVAGALPAPAVALPAPADEAEPDRTERPALDGPARRTPAAPKVYVVKRRDTLWDIADRHLADPLRWREIFRLNEGRRQPDGRRLKDPHWIYPGWELVMPADATGVPTRPARPERSPRESSKREAPPGGKAPVPAPAPTTAPAPAPTTAPAPPPTTAPAPPPTAPPTTAPAPPPTAPPTAPSIPAPTPALPVPTAPSATTSPGKAPAPPSTRPPSGEATVPPGPPLPGSPTVPAAGPQPTLSPPVSTPAAPERPPFGTSADDLSTNEEGNGADLLPVPTEVIGAGLLAVGVIATLAHLRRAQQRRRRAGRRIRLPQDGAARAESVLHLEEAPEDASFLDLALRAMAGAVRRGRLDLPQILAVALDREGLQIVLERPTQAAPAPFSLAIDQNGWVLPRDAATSELEALAADVLPPLPTLVSVGLAGQARLLVNLEGFGLTALTGNAAATRGLLDAMAVELATNSLAGYFELVPVGFGLELDVLDRVRPVDSLDQVLERLESQARSVARLVRALGCGSVLAGRVLGRTSDSWSPTVVLCAAPPPPDALKRLVALTATPGLSNVCAVVAGDVPGARWPITVTRDALTIERLDLQATPQRLTPERYGAIATLLRVAADTADVAAGTPPYDELAPAGSPPPPEAGAVAPPNGDQRPVAAAPAPAEVAEPSSGVEVRVLGPVEVVGAQEIDRSKSIELIVYLALRPQGVDADRLHEAMWPGKPPKTATLNTTTSVARNRLGPAPDGTLYLPHAHDGVYRLHPAVRLDWTRFQALAARGRSSPEAGAAYLRQALELVRGRPFDAIPPRSYGWAIVDQAAMEAEVVDVADELARLCLEAGDHAGARWAARQGLLASPYDERLYRALMLAADAAGNPAGVDAVMDELLRLLEDDGLEPYDSLHETTRALYERLRPQRSRSRGNPEQVAPKRS